jgi:hypothetical protein
MSGIGRPFDMIVHLNVPACGGMLDNQAVQLYIIKYLAVIGDPP